MGQRRPIRLRTCLSCGRNFYSRSSLSKYCCVAHQVKEWRARNQFTHEQVEQQFIAQELADSNPPEQQETA